jgi:hypothetical protein
MRRASQIRGGQRQARSGVLTTKVCVRNLRFHPCCVVQKALALVGIAIRPAELGRPARLREFGLGLLRRAVCLRVGLVHFGNIERAGFGRRGEVDVGLGTVIDIGRDGYSLGSAESLGDGLDRVNWCPLFFLSQTAVDRRTSRTWAAFSSGLASGSKVKAATPAFLLCSTTIRLASSAVTLLSGSRAASIAPCCLSSVASRSVAIVARR